MVALRYSGLCQDRAERMYLHEFELEIFGDDESLELGVYFVQMLGRSSVYWDIWLFRVFGYDYEREDDPEYFAYEEELLLSRISFVLFMYAWENGEYLGHVH